MARLTRPNWYDFQKVTTGDLTVEQDFFQKINALSNVTASGTGVVLEFPTEKVIFNSNSLTSAQSGWASLNTFDGRGILESAYSCSDAVEGNQISILVSDARLSGYVDMTVTLIGKLFDDSLTYEHIEVPQNGSYTSKNHYKSIVNILFQNFFGNSNTYVDGYGSFNVGGTVLISEASALKASRDLICAEQIRNPDIIFRDYKVYDPGKSLSIVIQEAIGSSNNIDDLDINTTTASFRKFTAGASTELTYGIKYKAQGNNVQKVSLLLGLEAGSGGIWSGSLVVGIRALQTSNSDECLTSFLPDNDIDFDPETVPLEEISLDMNDLADRGIVLGTTPKVVDFVFTQSNISNPNLSNIEEDKYYIVTIRRTGSTTTGTLFMNEALNDSDVERLSVFSSGAWTDVPNSSLWFRVYNDSFFVASGTAYDAGVLVRNTKTLVNTAGTVSQNIKDGIPFYDTSEDTENYLVLQKAVEFSGPESHPRTGDLQYSLKEDVPTFAALNQSNTLSLLESQSDLIVLARGKDTNPRFNPIITGTLPYPGMAMGNRIDIIAPSTDLLVHNVVGSVITPNILLPTLKYRIISQEIVVDGYGDIDGDGDIDLDDVSRLQELDGYSLMLDTGSVPAATQLAAVLNGSVEFIELLKSDLNADGLITNAADLIALNNYITNGTAFPSGFSEYTRVRLLVEPILDPLYYLNTSAESLLKLEDNDPTLVSSTYTPVDFSIEFIPTWSTEFVEITDLRRYVNSTFLEFSADDLQNSPENGGKNNMLMPGDLYLEGNVKNFDGSFHKLDYEKTVIEIDLPDGTTEGELNIFDKFVKAQMKFSDGTLVSASALSQNQVRFELALGAHVKNMGAAVDGYVDFDGYGDTADESIGLYLDHNTGLLRIKAYNIVHNEIYPEIRTRIVITVSLKKAGFTNGVRRISSTELGSLLT